MPLINRSLFVRMALLILGGAAVVLLALVTFNHIEMRREMLGSQQRYFDTLAQSAARHFDQQLLAAQKEVDEAVAIFTYIPLNRDSALNILERTMEHNPDIYGSAIALAPQLNSAVAGFQILYSWRDNGNGSRQTIDRSSPLQDYQSDWFYLPYYLQQPVWIDPYYDLDTNTLMITYAAPVVIDGQVMAVITSDLSLAGVQAQLEGLELGQQGYPLVISRFGKFIVHPDSRWVNSETLYSLAASAATSQDHTTIADITSALTQQKSGTLRFKRYQQAEHAWLFFSTVPQTGWKVGFIIPERQILAPIVDLGVKTTLMALMGIALLLVPAFVIARTITRPLQTLCGAAEQLAGGHFDATLPPQRRRDEIGRLISAFDRMRIDLRSYIDKLTTTTAEKEKIASELAIAREIQHSILPKLFPPFPQRSGLDIFATLTSAREVGGDLYDFALLDDQHLYFCIGDVSDKGVPASLFMAVGKTLLKSTIQTIPDPAKALAHVNNEMAQGNDSCMFITLFCAVLNLENRELIYSNAGHNPPILITSDETRMLERAAAPPLAAMSDIEFVNQRMTLPEDALLFLYTDGVTEAMNEHQEIFGEERLLSLLAEDRRETAESCIGRVEKDVLRFVDKADQSDDITMLGLRYLAPGTRTASTTSPSSMLVLQNRTTELPRLVTWLEELQQQLGWSAAFLARLNLILEEWLVNVINYAFADHRLDDIEVRLWQTDQEVRMEISDAGLPFDPTTATAPDLSLPLEERPIGGLGLHFIADSLDEWHYTRNAGRNISTMMKKLPR